MDIDSVSNYNTRLTVANVFATLTEFAIKNTHVVNGQNNGNGELWTIESSFSLLSYVFIYFGIGGFLKSNVSITNISLYSLSKEIRNANLFTDISDIMELFFTSLFHPIQSTGVDALWALRCRAFPFRHS
uniref:Transmembrane protein n=1 Tax=Strongyloides venezuelensis TaxID=75913 RepID=A0A0K0F7R5_STRVS